MRKAFNRNPRDAFTADQKKNLCEFFAHSARPTDKQAQELSEQLGLTTRQVQVWFQNRRARFSDEVARGTAGRSSFSDPAHPSLDYPPPPSPSQLQADQRPRAARGCNKAGSSSSECGGQGAAGKGRRQRLSIGALAPHVVNVHATPPIARTPEEELRPEWWQDGEDDSRAAELIYTLFGGKLSAGLHKDIEDWVVRDNVVAREAFPHVSFWKELDIRYLRWSCEEGGVAEALRKLKATFARGEGHLRYVSVDRQGEQRPRGRRSAAEEAGPIEHPVRSLR